MGTAWFRQRRKSHAATSDPSDIQQSEAEIASRIQESILPQEVDIEGIEIAAGMLPAESVSGDFYDVIPIKNGCWIGIGDVAGHGLNAGLIFIMIQSALQALVNLMPDASPRDLVCALNRVLYENIRRRMKQDEHVTLSLVRYSADGSLVWSGAHEDILIIRKDGSSEALPTPGAWLGILKDISHATTEAEVQLQPGELMLLYTDGLLEARNDKGVQFGFERLRQLAKDNAQKPAQVVRDTILETVHQWAARLDDDVTLIAVRCQGVYWST